VGVGSGVSVGGTGVKVAEGEGVTVALRGPGGGVEVPPQAVSKRQRTATTAGRQKMLACRSLINSANFAWKAIQ